MVVYLRSDENDILFSRRLVVYENEVTINPKIMISTKVKNRRTHQQIDFDIDYDHDHGGSGSPHGHEWGRPSDGSPPTHNDRGPGIPL